jgi:hypothetical protein
MSRRLKSSRVWFLGLVSVALLATAIAIAHIDVRVVLDEIQQLSAVSLLGAATLLIAGALLAAVRLWFISSDIGTPLKVKEALLALSLGQIVGAVSVQFFGQIAARSTLLGRRGVSTSANIVMATYERLVAVAVSGLMAIAGASYLFGHFAFDLGGGGTQFLEIVAGVAIAITAGAGAAWGSAVLRALLRVANARVLIAIARNAILTFTIQLTTAGAYVVIAHSMSTTTTLASLFAASVIIMFAASLPISFAGWGVRELSAVMALGAVGVKSSAALAIAVMIGAMALGAVIFVAGLAVITPTARETEVIRSANEAEATDLTVILKWILPLAAATAVFFQIYIPTGAVNLNVNLADPVVILGATLFILGYAIRGEAHWCFASLNFSVVIATIVITVSCLHGYLVFGWTEWAFTNRLFGWFMLLCYGMTGALIVRHAGERGATMFARTFIASAAAIVLFELALVLINIIWVRLPSGVLRLPMEGFSQNRNAFSFGLLLAISAMPMIPRHFRSAALAILMLGLWFSGSRAALGTFIILTGVMLFLKAVSLRELFFAVFGFGVGILSVSAVSAVSAHTGLFAHIPIFTDNELYGSSNIQRIESIRDGFQLFLSHPIFGAGIGIYMSEQIKTGTPLVIHSTPVWLLAETGIIGFVAFAVPAICIFFCAWPRRYRDAAAQTIILALVAFAVMSSVHELLYQRALWLLLGVAASLTFESEAQP